MKKAKAPVSIQTFDTKVNPMNDARVRNIINYVESTHNMTTHEELDKNNKAIAHKKWVA